MSVLLYLACEKTHTVVVIGDLCGSAKDVNLWNDHIPAINKFLKMNKGNTVQILDDEDPAFDKVLDERYMEIQ